MAGDDVVKPNFGSSGTKDERPYRDYSAPIAQEKLDGSNYVSWSRNAFLTITGPRMAGFINGKKLAPKDGDSVEYSEWEEDNCLVQIWLLNSMTRSSVTTTQNGESVAMFYEELHVIWEEIDNLRANPHTNPKDVALRHKEIESERVYDFLGGLDPQFNGVRSRILAMTPVHSVLEAYALVVEESTRQVTMLGVLLL
ncbi:hypothetical protein ACFX19_039457 [Malus domestica]